jgi:GH25 family lysozyme M1 (1,4-beta-N-acetylmuramidase)
MAKRVAARLGRKRSASVHSLRLDFRRAAAAAIEPLEGRVLLSRALGIDVSSYQGSPNWSSVYGSGVSFAYVKATQGNYYTDPSFASDMSGATGAGIIAGAYDYADFNNVSAVAEANYFLSVAQPYVTQGYLRPMLGIGGTTSMTQAQVSSWVNTWIQTVYNATKVDTVIYTNQSFASTYLNSTVTGNQLFIDSWNGQNPSTGQPSAITPWSKWALWQYSDTGSVPGISGAVDMDVANGAAATWVIPNLVASANAAFSSGQVVDVAATGGVQVWNTYTSDGTYTTEPNGTSGTVESKPVFMNGVERYQVKYSDGTTGWSAASDLTTTPTRVTAQTLSGTTAVVRWMDVPSASSAFNVYASSDGGATYSQVAAPQSASTTAALITGLTPDTPYTFKVAETTPDGTQIGGTGVSPSDTTGDPSSMQWYTVSLPEGGNVQVGSCTYSTTGSVSLNDPDPNNSVWSLPVQADSWQAAVYQAISGYAYVSNTQTGYSFPDSGAFGVADASDVSGLPAGVTGEIIDFEDSYQTTDIDLDYNDDYVPVDVKQIPNVVNATTDVDAIDPTKTMWDGNFNSEDDPEVSLRSAIEYANAQSGPQTIGFDIPDSDPGDAAGVWTIAANALPGVSVSLTVDGSSQPGYADAPVIAVSGSGFDLQANDCAINDLSIIRATGPGVQIDGTSDNSVADDYIGLDPAGNGAGNLIGVSISNGQNNTVTQSVISANTQSGILITGADASANSITANLIGTNVTGDGAGAGIGNNSDGVLINDGADSNTVDSNTISGNFGNGVHITDESTDSNTISNNDIGTPQGGGTLYGSGLGNGHDGVFIESGASSNSVDSNIISANYGNGVHVSGSGTSTNVFSNNQVGLDQNGDPGGVFGNNYDGVLVDSGATSNSFSSDTISANFGNGAHITGSGTNDNSVTDCNIGVNPAGLVAGNQKDGVLIELGASSNLIESDSISGNGQNGVHLSVAGTTDNVISSNHIGTDANGTNFLGNTLDGVLIESGANSNTVGPFNTISGNSQNGVHVSSASQNTILGNVIGTDDGGDSAIANSKDGVLIDGGGAQNSVTGNTISGNTQNGVHLFGDGSNQNTVSQNDIGINNSEDGAIPNGQDGVLIESRSSNNTLDADNIDDNTQNGVHISGYGTNQNTVSETFIGVAPDGITSLPNGQSGVLIDSGAMSNTVGAALDGGGTSKGNTIAYNTLDGVTITGDSTTDNSVLQDSIYDNGRLGINLGGGAALLPNDDQDPDTGANNLQTFPMVNGVTANIGGGSVIIGHLNSTPSSSFHIELFGNNSADTSWNFQGRTYLGATDDVVTDANGNASFTLTISSSVSNVTATATDSDGNTSEEFGLQLGAIKTTLGGISQTSNDHKTDITDANAFAVTLGAGTMADQAVLDPADAPESSVLSWDTERHINDALTGTKPPITINNNNDHTLATLDNSPGKASAGSFNEIVYYDANGNGKYDVGEELCVLHLAIVSIQVGTVNAQTPGTFSSSVNGAGAAFSSGTAGTPAITLNAPNVVLQGGGSDEMIGVSKIGVGFLQDGVSDSLTMAYGGAGQGVETLKPGGSFPILDGAHAASGGYTPFQQTPPPPAANPGGGESYNVSWNDYPGAGFDQTHAFGANPASQATQLTGNNTFMTRLLAFSTDFNTTYTSYYAMQWACTFDFAWNAATNTWDDKGSSSTINSTSTSPQGGDPGVTSGLIFNDMTTVVYH